MDIRSLLPEDMLDDVSSDLVDEFRMAVKTLGEQLSNNTSSYDSTYDQQNYYFTLRFYRKAEELNLKEDDALDVYHNGQILTEEMMVKEYNGYEIGIEYTMDQFSGKPVITSIWKRNI